MRQSTCLCYAWQFTCLELSWSCHDSLQTAKTVFWSWSCYGWQSTCRDAALNKNPLVLKLPCMTIQFGFPCTAACDRFNSYINIFCCFFLSACVKERKRWLYVIICVWNCVQFKKIKMDHGIQVLLICHQVFLLLGFITCFGSGQFHLQFFFIFLL